MTTREIPERSWRAPASPPEEAGDRDQRHLGGTHLDRLVRQEFPDVSWNRIRIWIRGGNVLVEGRAELDPTVTVSPGAQVNVSPRPSRHARGRKEHGATRASSGAGGGQAVGARGKDGNLAPPTGDGRTRRLIVHLDSQIVVADKPSGISTVPYDASERDSLERRVQQQLRGRGGPARLQVVHRIDKETSGLIVFARTHHALERLKSQFRFHTVDRKYQALVHGRPRHQTHRSRLVRDRGDGLRGSTEHPSLGRESVTHVRVLDSWGDGSLVECELETGRTHQIRIHLSESGHPLLGERVYTKGYSGTLLEAPRVMLHAMTLGFEHPSSGERLQFESEPPQDFIAQLALLRAKASQR